MENLNRKWDKPEKRSRSEVEDLCKALEKSVSQYSSHFVLLETMPDGVRQLRIAADMLRYYLADEVLQKSVEPTDVNGEVRDEVVLWLNNKPSFFDLFVVQRDRDTDKPEA